VSEDTDDRDDRRSGTGRGGSRRARAAQEDGRVRADVVDDGSGPTSSDGGTGLRGLTERVNAIGGHLEAGRVPARGFKLSITAPVAGA